MENRKTGFSQVYEEDLPWVSKILEQLISGEVERNKIQHRNTTKDGRVIWCEWFNSVLKDNEGKVKTIMSLVQDITEQKNLEWQKDNFLSIVSHELKTPLTTIKAYGQIAENMLEEKGDEDTLRMVKKWEARLTDLLLLFRNLLEFYQNTKRQINVQESIFDFKELVKDVIEDLEKTRPYP